MKETKFTPGPWEFSFESDSFVGAYGGMICKIPPVSSGGDPARNWKYNAHLIAAAPDLLEFAEEWLSTQGSDENYMTEKARAALAKARGEK